jgi:CPA1 family monovalent cation:H+ antiporter
LRSVEIVLGLLALAAVVATLADRLRAPAPSLLVLAGLLVGLVPGVPDIHLTPDLVSLVVLPPLLYAAATDVSLPDLRAVIRPVAALAVGLVATTAAAVALVVHAITPEVPLSAAFVLGAVLASTDPVAVSALARRLQLPPRVLALVQGESLLNDATSLVLFRVAVGVAAAGGTDLPDAAWQFVRLGGGGALIGLALALLVALARRRTEDAVLETVMALLTPYAAYVAAEEAHTSGVTAVVVAGLWLGDRAVRLSSGPVRLQIANTYAVVVFLLESLVFAVIGLELPELVRELPASERGFVPAALAVAGVLVATRVLWVYPVAYLPQLLRARRRQGASRPPWQATAVVSWVGTRGVVPLAAALSIPVTVTGGSAFPQRGLLLVLATSCIIVTLVLQGLTLGPLVSRLGVTDDPGRQAQEEALARQVTATAALARLDELADVEAAPAVVLERLRRDLEQRGRPGSGYPSLARDLLAVETAHLSRLRDEGRISEAVRRRVQRSIDLEEAGLRDDEF